MMELFLWVAGFFAAYVAAAGFDNARELWRIDHTKALLQGVAALCMALSSVFIFVLVNELQQ